MFSLGSGTRLDCPEVLAVEDSFVVVSSSSTTRSYRGWDENGILVCSAHPVSMYIRTSKRRSSVVPAQPAQAGRAPPSRLVVGVAARLGCHRRGRRRRRDFRLYTHTSIREWPGTHRTAIIPITIVPEHVVSVSVITAATEREYIFYPEFMRGSAAYRLERAVRRVTRPKHPGRVRNTPRLRTHAQWPHPRPHRFSV